MKTMYVAIGLLMFLGSGCACWTDQAKAKTPACVVVHDAVDCSMGAVSGVMPYFVQIVGKLISGGMDPNNIPWDDIKAKAEAMGIKDGGCFLAQLQHMLFGNPTASPALMAAHRKASDALAEFKQKKYGTTTVKFVFIDKDGQKVSL